MLQEELPESGTKTHKIMIPLTPDTKLWMIKQAIFNATGYPPDCQQLSSGGIAFRNDANTDIGTQIQDSQLKLTVNRDDLDWQEASSSLSFHFCTGLRFQFEPSIIN